jgi:hypothetical protein
LKSVAERISRLVRLAPRERRLLLRAWWQLLFVDIALRLVSVTRLLPRTAAATPTNPPLPLARIGWLLEVARRYSPVPSTCLKDALVLARMLRLEGIDVAVKIGVARGDGGLRAHAWVEHRGARLFQSADGGTYTALLPATEPLVAR